MQLEMILKVSYNKYVLSNTYILENIHKYDGHILAPPERLRAPELPQVNSGGRRQESGDDSKAI